MPEELNRTLMDQMSKLLFVTKPSAIENLQMEGIASYRIHLVGNILIDALKISMGQGKAKLDWGPQYGVEAIIRDA